jgi:hypothetical protein
VKSGAQDIPTLSKQVCRLRIEHRVHDILHLVRFPLSISVIRVSQPLYFCSQ